MSVLYLDLPDGDGTGWGVLGHNLVQALEAIAPVHLLRQHQQTTEPLSGPLLQGCASPYLTPSRKLKAPRRVAYAVFAIDGVARAAAASAHEHFDVLVTACRWGADVLRAGGFSPVETIHHGVDTVLFNPTQAPRRRFLDRFVVFSGGKLEFRKGQDVAVQAFRAFASRHPDALLVTAWRNPWRTFEATMGLSPYVPYLRGPEERYSVAAQRWLTANGLRPDQYELVLSRSNAEMASVYGESDVGLFHVRCEGATNMVLMEYMACGRAAIATDFSGHHDILTDANSFPLRAWRPLPVSYLGAQKANWCEPDLDEIVECLEDAYQHRDRLATRGTQAAFDMATFTWNKTAKCFFEILVSDLPTR